MAIIEKVELWWVQCDPAKPNPRLDKENPSWEVQIRTARPEQKAEWETAGLKCKVLQYGAKAKDADGNSLEGENILDANGKKQWYHSLKKRSMYKDLTTGQKKPANPPQIVDGGMKPMDPNSIGNGSIGNVNFSTRKYQKPDGSPGIASTLLGLQITKLLVYTPAPAFGVTNMEIIDNSASVEEDAGEGFQQTSTVQVAAPRTPAVKPVDEKPEDAF